MSWHIVRWDEEKVRGALKRGSYDDVSLTGWGRLDDLVALSHALEVFREFERLEAPMKGEGYIPPWFMNTALLFRSYQRQRDAERFVQGCRGVMYAWGDGGGDAGGVRGGSQWRGAYAVSRGKSSGSCARDFSRGVL